MRGGALKYDEPSVDEEEVELEGHSKSVVDDNDDDVDEEKVDEEDVETASRLRTPAAAAFAVGTP